MDIRNNDLRSADLKRLEAALGSDPEAKLYILGCTETAAELTKYIERESDILKKLAAFSVDDIYYDKDCFCGKPVIKYSQMLSELKNGDAVIIGYNNTSAAMRALKNLPAGIEGAYFFLPVWYPGKKECMPYELYKKHEQEYESLYKKLADEKSRQTMEAFLNCCISGDGKALTELCGDSQYFDSVTQTCKAETFIDCGAFDGDTIEKAVSFYGDKIKKIVAFEPDKANLMALSERMKKCGVDESRLILECKGSWSKADTLRFSSAGSSSGITDDGDIVIEVDSIDNTLKREGISADYIKIDVEGSEEQTLIGASETIKAYLPTLAVCIYHKQDDLLVIPSLIEKIAGEGAYDFYIRYYGPRLTELVIYAIPRRAD